MLCQNCGKNEATTHIKRVVNGEAAENHLCSKCAEALGYNDFFGDFGLSISDMFTSFFGDSPLSLASGRIERCESCGSTFEDIIKTGKVGCPSCYEKFYDRLLPSVQRIHGRAFHAGKKPGLCVQEKPAPAETKEKPEKKRKLTKEEKLADLEAKMQKAVDEQNFELAAQIRDSIKELKGEN